MSSDIWSVKHPQSNTTAYVAADSLTTGAQTLVNTSPAPLQQGAGYKVSITSDGNDTNTATTIVGQVVGDVTGASTTETVSTGPNAATVYSTKYFSAVSAISISQNSVGSMSMGYGGDLALPRTRMKAVDYVAAASAGTIKATRNSDSRVIFDFATPADATAQGGTYFPGEGILTVHNSVNDFTVINLTNVTFVTLYCG